MSEQVSPQGSRPGTARGLGRLLVAVYAVFAISATARATYQLLTDFSSAPLPYLLSAFAAGVYCVATVALARESVRAHRVATIAVLIELVGVLSVGALSMIDAADFPQATVWSGFGRGYGYVPLVLPIVGLWWLRSTRPAAAASVSPAPGAGQFDDGHPDDAEGEG